LGNGQLRLYVDLTPVAALGSELSGMAPEGLNLMPLVNAVAGFGQIGMRLRVTGAGVEAATVLAPAATKDPALASLLLGKPGAPLQAAGVVPSTAVSFSTSAVNMGGLYTYLNTLVDKTGLNPGGLDALAAQELGLDLRKNLINWMGGEIATAQFNVASKTNPLESVYFIRVTDPQAAQAGLEASVPVIAKSLGQALDTAGSELGAATGGKGKVTTPPVTAVKATPGSIAGVNVTRWGNGSTAVITAFQNNFLIVATSEAGMTAALAGGPRLSAASAWTSTVAKAPANATALSMTNEAATLRAAATAMNAIGPALSAGLSGELGQGAEAYSGTAMGFLTQIGGFLNALASRAGTSYGWTAVSNGRLTTTSFVPMRW
ncbi:MAG TPA: hypothetical protein VHN99_10690, partial [Deinococcales bacterium]|nr:hypothetical protein [Deinococcales bacterium]